MLLTNLIRSRSSILSNCICTRPPCDGGVTGRARTGDLASGAGWAGGDEGGAAFSGASEGAGARGGAWVTVGGTGGWDVSGSRVEEAAAWDDDAGGAGGACVGSCWGGACGGLYWIRAGRGRPGPSLTRTTTPSGSEAGPPLSLWAMAVCETARARARQGHTNSALFLCSNDHPSRLTYLIS